MCKPTCLDHGRNFLKIPWKITKKSWVPRNNYHLLRHVFFFFRPLICLNEMLSFGIMVFIDSKTHTPSRKRQVATLKKKGFPGSLQLETGSGSGDKSLECHGGISEGTSGIESDSNENPLPLKKLQPSIETEKNNSFQPTMALATNFSYPDLRPKSSEDSTSASCELFKVSRLVGM